MTHAGVSRKREEQNISFVKNTFASQLGRNLNLIQVNAPLFLSQSSGFNDDLNGVEKPISFYLPKAENDELQIVHSLAKWKRFALGRYGFEPGEGLYTDMRAIRKDEVLSSIHSIYVDQWDWELVIRKEQRQLDFLKDTVKKIYEAMRTTERSLCEREGWAPELASEITFVHSEDLLAAYPNMSPKERENEIVKKHGSVFLIGVGGRLAHGEAHDGRAPDYDDWTASTSPQHKGLNGDILVHHKGLNSAFELSSMGVRVDAVALREQCRVRGVEDRLSLPFHTMVLEEKVPFSIGGGIGQSRLCMFMLRKTHITDVQPIVTL